MPPSRTPETRRDDICRRAIAEMAWMARRDVAPDLGDDDPLAQDEYDAMMAAAAVHQVPLRAANNREPVRINPEVGPPDPLPTLPEIAVWVHLHARRYASGRRTYAPEIVDEQAAALVSADVVLAASASGSAGRSDAPDGRVVR